MGGFEYKLILLDNKELPLTEYFAKVGIKVTKALDVKKMEEMTPEQERLFEFWSKNLER